MRIATVVGCGFFGVRFRVFLPALALGAFAYIGVYTFLGYFVGHEIFAVLAHSTHDSARSRPPGAPSPGADLVARGPLQQ